jgi:hypothetical protein
MRKDVIIITYSAKVFVFGATLLGINNCAISCSCKCYGEKDHIEWKTLSKAKK